MGGAKTVVRPKKKKKKEYGRTVGGRTRVTLGLFNTRLANSRVNQSKKARKESYRPDRMSSTR